MKKMMMMNKKMINSKMKKGKFNFFLLPNALKSRFETLEFYQIEREQRNNNQNDHEYIQSLDAQSAQSTGL